MTATMTTEALHWLEDPFTAQEQKHSITAMANNKHADRGMLPNTSSSNNTFICEFLAFHML